MLSTLFERHVNDTYVRQLEHQLTSLTAALDWSPEGRLLLTRAPADRRYERPYSGAYWQARAPGALLRSRSLWDTEMPKKNWTQGSWHARGCSYRAQPAVAAGGVAQHRPGVVGHAGGCFRGTGPHRTACRAARLQYHAGVVAGWHRADAGGAAQVRFGLAPLKRLRQSLSAMQARRESRLGGKWPTEVEPLVGPAVRELTRALTRLHGARQIDIDVQGEGHFAGDRQDLVEMLGNLLDNASPMGALAGTYPPAGR
ncbi:hypothetical protein ACTMU2_01970 [Cupriavidus basilensis]